MAVVRAAVDAAGVVGRTAADLAAATFDVDVGHWILLGFAQFYWVLLGFNEVHWVFTSFYWVLLGFTGFMGFYLVLLGSTHFYWVLLGFT